MKDGSYVVIQSFMVNELKLKGNELIVYATIYGFSQDGCHWFYGTRGYLAEWCGAKRETVDRCLKLLIAKGYVERRDVEEHGQTSVQYRATKNAQGTQKSSTPPQKTGTPTPKIEHINNLDGHTRESIYSPTLEEVEQYVREKGYHFDPRHFFEYYSASGWKMQSGKPVKSWKQCCVTWERNAKKSGRKESRRPANDGYVFDPSQYNYF